jgi:4-amino-4-deoxy-L-arabinose transferase-like glycosyltransferase
MTRRNALVSAAGIGGLYALLRGLRIAWFPPFLDEGIYARWTRTVFEDPHQRFIALANGKEPLLTWLAAAAMKTGLGPLGAQRAVSVVAGAVTLVVVGLIGRELAGPVAGLLSSALYAVLPFFVVHDGIGIMEPLLAAATTTALYLQIRLARAPRVGAGLGLGVALAAALLTKETALYALVLMPAALLVFRWDGPLRRRRLLAWLGANAIAAATAGIGYSILRLSDLFDDLATARESIHMYRSPGDALARPWHWLWTYGPDFASVFVRYTTLTLFLAACLGLVVSWRRARGFSLLLALWVLVPFGISSFEALIAYPRYVVDAAPPLVPLAAVGLLAVVERARAARRLELGLAVAALLVVPALVADARLVADPGRTAYPGLDDTQFATGWAAGNAWVALEDELARRRPAGVLVGDYGLGSPLPDLDGRGVTLADGPSDDADKAPYVVDNGAAPPTPAVGELREVWRYDRPRDGTPLVLYARGVDVDGTFVTNAHELRTAVGAPSDHDFDVWLSAHPQALDWYDAWHADERYR